MTEILDDGNTLPADADFSKLITTDVKFVIQGDMPDPSSTNVLAEQQQIQNVLSQYKAMQEAALDNGVRIISLSDFLNFVGHKVERRLYRPGDDVGYNLKNGSRSAAVDETVLRLGSRSQRTGQNAGVYDKSNYLRKRSSTGQTSKKFTNDPSK